jgi:hypothetical protein
MTSGAALRWCAASAALVLGALLFLLGSRDGGALVAPEGPSERMHDSPAPTLEPTRVARLADPTSGGVRIDGDAAGRLPEQAEFVLMTKDREVLRRLRPSDLSSVGPELLEICEQVGLSFFGAQVPDCECEVEFGDPNVLIVKVPPYMRLRVRDAATREPLAVFAHRGSSGQREFPEPTALARRPIHSNSQGELYLPIEDPPRQWFIGARGYAWREWIAGGPASAELECELDRGGDIEIDLLGWPAAESPRIILSRLAQSVATPIGLLPNPGQDRISRMSGIREGAYQVAVFGAVGREHIGATTVEVQRGEVSRAQVRIDSGTGLGASVSVRLHIDVAQGWPRRDWEFSLVGPGARGFTRRLEAHDVSGGERISLSTELPGPGKYALGEAAVGWRQTIEVRRAGDVLECEVLPPGDALVQVVGEGGELDPSQVVVNRRFQAQEDGLVTLFQLTASSGDVFQFTAAPGTHGLDVHADGWISAEGTVDISSTSTARIRIVMRKYAAIRVERTDSGKADLRVRLSDAEQEPLQVLHTYSVGASKVLVIGDLLPGSYLVEWIDQDGAVLGGRHRVDLRAGQVADLALR